MPDAGERPVVVERRQTPRGELVLRQAGGHFEVIANGTFLMDTRDGRSERALVRLAVAGRADTRVLIGGLGVGFSLDEALAGGNADEVVVVEIEPVVVEWTSTHLRELSAHGLEDSRVRLVVADLGDVLESLGTFDAICLDVDNGPSWLLHDANARLYDDAGLARLRAALNPGGRLAVWSAAPDDAFATRVEHAVGPVERVTVPVARGPDDEILVAMLG